MFILELSKRRNGWVNLKGKDIVAIFFALIISFGAVYLTNRPIADKDPIPCYRVYLEGKSLGLITSKDELNDYINKQQEKLKEQYKVDTVFIPNDIDVVKDVTYDNNFSTIEEIYNKINEVSPFTIKGYRVKIDRSNTQNYRGDEQSEEEQEKAKNKEDIISINILDRQLFEDAMKSVVLSFVTDEEYKAFNEGSQKEIESTGEVIEDIFIDNPITIQEINIPTNEKIYTKKDDLIKYLIFGDNESDKT